MYLTNRQLSQKGISKMNELNETPERTEARIHSLEEASELLGAAIELIQDAVDGTEHEASAEAYIISHLQNWMDGRHNPYDESIAKLIEAISAK